jgi:hypothetical protein
MRMWVGLIIVAILATAAAGWRLLGEPPAPAPKIASITASDVKALQAQADGACLCARNKGKVGDKRCWAEFEEKVARYEHSESLFLCGSESPLEIHFPSDNGAEGMSERVVLKRRSYNACTAEEERFRIARAEAAISGGGCSG